MYMIHFLNLKNRCSIQSKKISKTNSKRSCSHFYLRKNVVLVRTSFANQKHSVVLVRTNIADRKHSVVLVRTNFADRKHSVVLVRTNFAD